MKVKLAETHLRLGEVGLETGKISGHLPADYL